MRTALDDFALFEHHNLIASTNGRETMGNNERTAALADIVHRLLDGGFAAAVDVGGGFI